MKFSDAVMLGSTMIKLNPGVWVGFERNENGEEVPVCGCLIGMSAVAISKPICGTNATMKAFETWPWIKDIISCPEMAKMEIDCATFVCTISHLADQIAKDELTFEQAVDWIRSVEPEETVEATTEEKVEHSTVSVG